MVRLELPAAVASTRVLAILRGLDVEAAVAAGKALHTAGVLGIEVTLDSPGALDSIRALADVLPDDAVVGAGTVLSNHAAREATAAGARFLVTPVTDVALIGEASARGVPVVPGAMTPTEVHAAWSAGAAAVKLFPAGSLGPRYLKELRGPLGFVPIVATGGVTGDDAAEWVACGAVAVGVGGWLVGGGDDAHIAARASQLLAAVSS